MLDLTEVVVCFFVMHFILDKIIFNTD